MRICFVCGKRPVPSRAIFFMWCNPCLEAVLARCDEVNDLGVAIDLVRAAS